MRYESIKEQVCTTCFPAPIYNKMVNERGQAKTELFERIVMVNVSMIVVLLSLFMMRFFGDMFYGLIGITSGLVSLIYVFKSMVM